MVAMLLNLISSCKAIFTLYGLFFDREKGDDMELINLQPFPPSDVNQQPKKNIEAEY